MNTTFLQTENTDKNCSQTDMTNYNTTQDSVNVADSSDSDAKNFYITDSDNDTDTVDGDSNNFVDSVNTEAAVNENITVDNNLVNNIKTESDVNTESDPILEEKLCEAPSLRKSPRQLALKCSHETPKSPGKVFVRSGHEHEIGWTEVSEQVYVLRDGQFVPLLSMSKVSPSLGSNTNRDTQKQKGTRSNFPIIKPKNQRIEKTSWRSGICTSIPKRLTKTSAKICSGTSKIRFSIKNPMQTSPKIVLEKSASNCGTACSTGKHKFVKKPEVDGVAKGIDGKDFKDEVKEKESVSAPEDGQLIVWDEHDGQEDKEDPANKFDVKAYVCSLCGQRFSFLSALVMHKKQVHVEEKPFSCTMCGDQFRLRHMLKRHLTKVHGHMVNNITDELNKSSPLLNVYACGECGKVFKSSTVLTRHKKDKHGDDVDFGHKCYECGLTFSLPESLQFHLRIHNSDKPFKCTVCNMGFDQAHECQRHQARHFTGYRLTCYMCDNIYVTLPEARKHMDQHHKTGEQYTCNVQNCGKSFVEMEDVQSHYRYVHRNLIKPKTKRHVCELCGKSFQSLSYFRNHKLVHNGERPHVCEVCGRAFGHKNVLSLHETTHRRREIACEICGDLFPNNHQLRSHQRKHNDARPFQCQTCGLQFKWRTAMNNHAKRVHTTIRPFKCDDCGHSFPLLGSLNTHRKIHSGIKPNVCEHCGKAFVRKKHLRVHMRIHTGEKPYRCYLCERRFTQMTGLKCHVKTHGDDYDNEVHKRLYSTSVMKQRMAMKILGGDESEEEANQHRDQATDVRAQGVEGYGESSHLEQIMDVSQAYNPEVSTLYEVSSIPAW